MQKPPPSNWRFLLCFLSSVRLLPSIPHCFSLPPFLRFNLCCTVLYMFHYLWYLAVRKRQFCHPILRVAEFAITMLWLSLLYPWIIWNCKVCNVNSLSFQNVLGKATPKSLPASRYCHSQWSQTWNPKICSWLGFVSHFVNWFVLHIHWVTCL